MTKTLLAALALTLTIAACDRGAVVNNPGSQPNPPGHVGDCGSRFCPPMPEGVETPRR